MNVNFKCLGTVRLQAATQINNASRNIFIHRYEVQACHYLNLIVLALVSINTRLVLVLLNRNLFLLRLQALAVFGGWAEGGRRCYAVVHYN